MRIAEDEIGPLHITASPGFIGRLIANLKYPGYRVETVLVELPAAEAWMPSIGRGPATERAFGATSGGGGGRTPPRPHRTGG